MHRIDHRNLLALLPSQYLAGQQCLPCKEMEGFINMPCEEVFAKPHFSIRQCKLWTWLYIIYDHLNLEQVYDQEKQTLNSFRLEEAVFFPFQLFNQSAFDHLIHRIKNPSSCFLFLFVRLVVVNHMELAFEDGRGVRLLAVFSSTPTLHIVDAMESISVSTFH